MSLGGRSVPARSFSISAFTVVPLSFCGGSRPRLWTSTFVQARRLPPQDSCIHLAPPIAINLRHDFARFDLAAAAPENVGVVHRHADRMKMSIYRRFVFEQKRFVGTVRDRHDVDVFEFGPGFAPGFDLAPGRNGPMKKRVESRHAHARLRWLHVLEKSGEASDDFARR